ncbi:MAG: VOC family protein [Leptospira sp.]|nr:VOC family protein [Leptospira sp.]
MFHHIAITTNNLEKLKEFYTKLPGTGKAEDKYDSMGNLRSVWFIQEDESIFMLEKSSTSPKAPEAIVFRINPKIQLSLQNAGYLEKIKHKTEFTIYFEDPDGNTVGFSSYPEKVNL